MGDVEPDRCDLRATATRWVADEPQPGIIEVQFTDYHGRVVTIHEKSAVISGELLPTTDYPVEVRLLCEIIAVSTLAWAVRLVYAEDVTGRTEFMVNWQAIDTGASQRPPGRDGFLDRRCARTCKSLALQGRSDAPVAREDHLSRRHRQALPSRNQYPVRPTPRRGGDGGPARVAQSAVRSSLSDNE